MQVGPTMRSLQVIALAVAAVGAACTHTHRVARSRPLPEDSVSHLQGAIEGVGLGLLVGATGGAVLGYLAGDDPECGQDDPGCSSITADNKARLGALGGSVLFGMSGLVLGALVGSHHRYEYRDDSVPVISASIGAGQASAAASWRF